MIYTWLPAIVHTEFTIYVYMKVHRFVLNSPGIGGDFLSSEGWGGKKIQRIAKKIDYF